MIDRDNNPVYIFHTQQPPMLIEIHHEAIVTNDGMSLTVNYRNIDGDIETITFTVPALLICEETLSNELKNRVLKVLDKAWHWYVAYLKWEDEQ